MTGARAASVGLFVDGPVGSAVLALLARRRLSAIAYVVVPSAASSVVLERYAELGLSAPLLQWNAVAEANVLPMLNGHVPDVVILAWWPHLVRGSFLTAGQSTTLNMHPSLLPFGRGKDPNFWALANREPFGVTIHHVDETIDGGALAFQSALPVAWDDTGETLHQRAQAALVELFDGSLDAILAGEIPRLPQSAGTGSFHRRSDLDPRSEVDLDRPTTARELLDLLRARTFSPHPGCRFSDDGATYEVRVSINRVADAAVGALNPGPAADTRPGRP